MGITQTPRLQLQKQAAGDPSWHTALDAGFDNADARLLKISSDNGDAPDPNVGPIAGDYVGQKYIDETVNPPRIWICTTDSTPGPTVWRLQNTTGVVATAPGHGGNTVLEDILADFQSRINTLETAIPAPPRGYIDGLVLNKSDASTFSITAGESAEHTQTRMLQLASGWTKTTGAFAAGSGNGARATDLDAVGADEWYHVFHMFKDTGSVTDFGLDEEIDASNLQGTDAFNRFHRIGSLYLDTGPAIKSFLQNGDMFLWYNPGKGNGTLVDQDLTGLSARGLYTVLVPPGLEVIAILNIVVWGDDDRQLYVSSPDVWPSDTPSISAPPLCTIVGNYVGTGSDYMAQKVFVRTNTSQQIALYPSASIDHVLVSCLGWIDPRDKNLETIPY